MDKVWGCGEKKNYFLLFSDFVFYLFCLFFIFILFFVVVFVCFL